MSHADDSSNLASSTKVEVFGFVTNGHFRDNKDTNLEFRFGVRDFWVSTLSTFGMTVIENSSFLLFGGTGGRRGLKN